METDKILNAIELDPSVKFKTIMGMYNSLQEGEAFILHNDHDPKPLFYQLSATQGDVFTWEYLKQGPDIFDIRIAKKIISNSHSTHQEVEVDPYFSDNLRFDDSTPETVRTIAAKDFRTVTVFQKYGIDYAWNGNQSLSSACEIAQVSEAEVRNALQQIQKDYSSTIPAENYYHWNMGFLADYILQTHHKYVKDNAERISKLAETAAKELGNQIPELIKFGEGVRPMIDDFMVHMSKEEDVLFPAIKHLLKLFQKGEKNPNPGGAMANAVAKMEAEHDETKAYLNYFKRISDNYKITEDTPELQKSLYTEIQLFENDCYKHVHLENNILFPKLIILEKK